MGGPKVRMVAGPNGSGKSTMISHIRQYAYLGPIINADVIEKLLKDNGVIKINDYLGLEKFKLTDKEWLDAINEIESIVGFNLVRSSGSAGLVRYEGGQIKVHEREKVDSSISAWIADIIRFILVKKRLSFTFETVMSHISKVDFLRWARKNGYRTYMYFVALARPELSIERVSNRVQEGGHPVGDKQVISRYHKSIDLIPMAMATSDRAYFIDNTAQERFNLFAEFSENSLRFLSLDIPDWFIRILVPPSPPEQEACNI